MEGDGGGGGTPEKRGYFPAKLRQRKTAVGLQAVMVQAGNADRTTAPFFVVQSPRQPAAGSLVNSIYVVLDSTFRYAGVYTAVCRVGSRDDIVQFW